MKITCDACGSKYSIADDKVRGKRVKVRCKSCQASILVDGTSTGDGSAGEDEGILEDASIAPAIPSSPDKPKLPSGTWSVNLSDDDSRDMTTAQVVAAWQKGEVTSDAYVWKDGMDDWTPIQDVPELRQKLGPARPAAPAKPATVARPAARASIADDGVTTSANVAKPVGKGRAGSMDDLFGGIDFAGKDEDQTAAAPTAAAEEKPRGARNESSVLFSLDALKAGVEAETAVAAPPAKLSDDPFNLGSGGGTFGGGFGGFGNAADLLTAPVKEPPRPVVQASPAVASAPKGGGQKRKGLLIGVVVGVLALGGAAFAMLGSGDDKTEEQTAGSEDTAKNDAAAEAEKKAMAEQLAKAEQEKKAMAEQLAKAEEEKKQAEASAAEAAKKEEEKPADTAKPAEAKATETKTVTASAAKTEPKPAAAAAPAAGIDMGAVKSALGAASAKAASCSKPGGPTGTGKAQVTFAPSGRVTNAVVTGGSFGGTAVGGCVASTFRAARVPAFSGAPVTVAKSFTVR